MCVRAHTWPIAVVIKGIVVIVAVDKAGVAPSAFHDKMSQKRKFCVEPGMTIETLYFWNLTEINLSVLLAISVLPGIRLRNKSFAQ